jgi:hypothetical protein
MNIMSYGALSTLNENSSGYSASSSLSSSSSNDNAHSIFQQHENLFNNQSLIGQDALNQEFSHLYATGGAGNFLANFQQQPQYF